MKITRLVAYVAGAVILVAGVALGVLIARPGGDTAAPAPAAAVSTPAFLPSPTPSVISSRVLCNGVLQLAEGMNLDPVANIVTAQDVADAAEPAISAAGLRLQAAAEEAEVSGDEVDDNIAIHRAQLEVLDACGDAFGDGPW